MSVHRILLPAIGMAIVGLLVTPVDASAQSYNRQKVDPHRYQSFVMRPAAQGRGLVVSRSAPQPARAVTASSRPSSPPPRRPDIVKVSPPPPLTEEERAAKAIADEILERDPALAAARERPDPRLARAITAKHDSQEKRVALRKAKEEADEAKRKEAAEKLKARQQVKSVATSSKSNSGGVTKAASQARANVASMTPRAVVVPSQPRRMPTPE